MSRVVKEYKEIMAFHPGAYLDDIIEEYEMTQNEFAKRLGVSSKAVSELLAGKQNLTIDMAERISSITGTSIDVWINLQNSYNKKVLEIEKRKSLDEEIAIARALDLGYLSKQFKREIVGKGEELVRSLRSLLKVANLKQLKNQELLVNYRNRTIEIDEKNIINSNIMLNIALEKAKETNVKGFDKKKLENNIKYIVSLHNKSFNLAYTQIEDMLRECGVVLIVLPYLKNASINGAVTRIDRDKVMLLLSDKQKYEDILWFTLLHEIAHIVNGDYAVDFSNKEKNKIEMNADKRAANWLINEEKFKNFILKNNFSREAIELFANNNNLHTGIVVGRLQKEKYISYKNFNDLRLKYKVI